MTDTSPGATPHRGAATIVCLVLILVVSGGIALARYEPAQKIEILLAATDEYVGSLQIGGAVTNPGIYPYQSTDSIAELLEAAGGLSSAGQPALILTVTPPESQLSAQKININTAGAWLLEALPGIGETRANAIILYRETHGPFNHISGIMQVNGIGQSLYDGLKDLITVTD